MKFPVPPITGISRVLCGRACFALDALLAQGSRSAFGRFLGFLPLAANMKAGKRSILLKNSIFRINHNLEDRWRHR